MFLRRYEEWFEDHSKADFYVCIFSGRVPVVLFSENCGFSVFFCWAVIYVSLLGLWRRALCIDLVMSRHIGFSEFSSVLFILCFSRLDSGIFDWCLSKYSWFFSASLFDRFLEELEDVTVCMSWKQIAGCSRNLEMFRVWGVWRSPRWLVGGLHGWEENGWPWDPSLTGAVLHDFTIGLLLVFDNLYFEENTFLYTLCICILCWTKANKWGYSNDITAK